MKYDDLQIGEVVRCGDCKDLIGDELTFAQLVREPGTGKLLVWMSATVGGELKDDSEFLVAQIERVEDFDPETDTDPDDVEWATVLLDIPGFSSKPVALEYEDMEEPEIEEGDDPSALHNHYHRIWRVKKALQPLERLALGAAIYSKCKANYIDSTEELLQAFESGLIRTVFSSPQISSIKTVLRNAHIEIPDKAAPLQQEEQKPEEPKQETAIVTAAPDKPSDPWTRAKALHQRIVNDAQAAAESIWDMSQAIKEMRDGKHYKTLLYDDFEGYCEEALGMSRAHAYRYIQIAEGMSAENVASMRQIGTTKLALLASVTEEQREIITTAVDVESATVKELRAEIDKLKGKVEKAEKERDKQKSMREEILTENAEMSDRISSLLAHVDELESNDALEKAQSRIRVLEAEKQQQADRKELLDAADAQIRRLNAEIANNSDYIGKLQAKITELENRPVEVAVQDNSEELEQLRAEYEKKLAEVEADSEYKELLAMCRLARQQVDTVCIRLKGLRSGKAKDSLVKYVKEIGLLLGQI